MASATCTTLAPTAVTIENGKRLCRCTNMVLVFNDTDQDIGYNVEATMSDSFGHSTTTSALGVIAPAGASGQSGPYFVDVDANIYNDGARVGFVCQLNVTGGFAAVDRQESIVVMP
jgi:hypothetical protein